MDETTPKAPLLSFDFSIPFVSPPLVTPTTSSTPHSPPAAHLFQEPMPDIFDPYSDALHQMSAPYVSSSRPAWKNSPPDSMGPPSHYGSALPPPNIFYGEQAGHHYLPPIEHERLRPAGITLPPPTPFLDRDYDLPLNYDHQHFVDQSPYQTPGVNPNSAGSSGSHGMVEYFPPYSAHSTPQLPYSGAYFSPTYEDPPHRMQGFPPVPGSKAKSQGKTTRQQFSACGACRHRRVKCDLKEQQDALELQAAHDGSGPMRTKKRKAVCSNCEERGVACVDEYAPIKAAKQLRRGKRISEIEHLYGKSAATAAAATVEEQAGLPELTEAFFESAFFRRFQVQRPLLDSRDFTQRYLSQPRPCAGAMGPEGAILCHVLYAWAVSYGVNENGQLDVPEGGGEPLGPLPLDHPTGNELRRQTDRQRRFGNMKTAVEVILREIDECGIMRKPTWDGVRVLLLVLPLTEGISPSVERLSMYETALNQVYSLCSFAGVGYDGQPAGTSGVNGGTDSDGRQNIQMTRVRIYWCITTGLKGGRLLLDDEDLDTMHDSIHNRAMVVQSSTMQTTVKFATAPINLALACRLINRALTGPSARRSRAVNGVWVKEAWEALEKSWEEFEALKYAPDSVNVYSSMDEVTRFADGWKIFLFEAQNVIRKILEERYAKLLAVREEAYISEPVGAGELSPAFGPERITELTNLQRLLDISRSKCEVQCRQILDMVKRHAGSRFFEWDASLVRDGTFYAAKLLPRMGGGEEDIAVCLQALNELRWAHAKAPDRSAELRQEWADSRQTVTPPMVPKWEAGVSPPQALPRWDCNTYPPSRPAPLQDNSFASTNSFSGPASPFPSQPNSGFMSQHPGYMPLHVHQHPQHSVYPEGTMMAERVPRGAAMDMSKAEWTSTGVDGIVDASQGYAVYGHIPGPPPLASAGLGLGTIGGNGSPEMSGYDGAGEGYEGYRSSITATALLTFVTIATSTPSPPYNGPSPRSQTSSKGSPVSSGSVSATASSGTSRLRPILPRPAGPTLATATASASSSTASGSRMEKSLRRTTGTGSKKGPFTVDSGGGKPPTKKVVGHNPAAGPSRVNISPAQRSKTEFQRPAPPVSRSQQQLLQHMQSQPQQYHPQTQFSPTQYAAFQQQQFMQPPLPMGVPQHSRHNSYQQDPYSSMSTTPNPLTPLDPASFGSMPMASPFASFTHQSPFPQGMPPMPAEPSPQPWVGSVPASATQSPVDWSSPAMSWLFPAGQNAGPEEAEANMLNSLAEFIQEDQSKEPSPQDIDAILQSAFEATAQAQSPPSVPQPSLLSRQMQNQAFVGNPLSRTNSGRSFQAAPVPTPPQSFGSSFTNKPNLSLWPLPDRANVYNDTPVTTPGGSDLGFGQSPAEPSSGSFRMQAPIRRAAPPPSATAFSSFSSSPSMPAPSSMSSEHAPPNWPPELSLSGLPPFPSGLPKESIANLTQYGQFGLEWAIRMGVGIGMNMGQQAKQQMESQAPPVPAPTKKRSGTIRPQPTLSTSSRSAPESVSTESRSPRTNVVDNILNDNFFAIRSPTIPAPFTFPSIRDVGSPEPTVKSPLDEAKDPLATWKAFGKAKDTLPEKKLENLTWRMFHLQLKKQEEEQAAGLSKSAGTSKGFQAGSLDTVREEKSANSPADAPVEAERGRSKGKSRVVGFNNVPSPQDSFEDGGMDWRAASRSRSRIQQDWRMASRSRSRSVAPRSTGFGSGSEQRAHDLLAQGPMLNGNMGQSMPQPAAAWQQSNLGAISSVPGDYSQDFTNDFGLMADAQNAFASSVPQDQSGLLGSPTKNGWAANLPGIAGPGLYTQTEENYHPQFGFLPRRVRKTSFDHTISQSPEHALRPLPDANPRKRHAEASPRPGPDARLPEEGDFPSSDFTFSFPQELGNIFDLPGSATAIGTNHPTPDDKAWFQPPQSGSVPHTNHPTPEENAWLSQSQPATGDNSAFGSPAPASFGIDPRLMSQVGATDESLDFTQLMSMYLNTNNSALPFTHVNPSHVLGQAENGLSGSSGEQSGVSASARGSFSQSPHVPPKQPTKPVPKTVGGKPVADRSTVPPPIRANSSPNLQALKMHSMITTPANSRPSTSKGTKQASTASTKKGSKSGATTPGSEDMGTGAKAGDVMAPLEDGETICQNCQTTNTPLWRRSGAGEPLCNACGLFFKLHGISRPISLKTDVIKKRNRNTGTGKDAPGQKKAGSNTSSSSTKSKGSTSQSKPASPSATGAMTILKKQRRASDGRSVDLSASQPGSSFGFTPGRNGFSAGGLQMSTSTK